MCYNLPRSSTTLPSIPDGEVADFLVGVEVWLVHRRVRGNQGDTVFLLLDALDGGLVAVDHHDGDVTAFYVLLLADDDDVAF